MKLFKKNIPVDIEKDPDEGDKAEIDEDIKSEETPNYEYIKAKIDSLEQHNKSTNERFLALNEQLGELRASGFDRDKKIGEIEAKSLKAMDIVEEIKPEEIIEMTQKTDIKMQQLNEKINSNKLLMDNIMQEIKEMRDDMKIFKDAKGILKLEEEVRKQLINVQKVKSIVDTDASKVESIFVDVQKQFTQTHRINNLVNDMRHSLENGLKEIDKTNVRVTHLADKEAIEELKDKINSINHKIASRHFHIPGADTSAISVRLDSLEEEITNNQNFTEKLLQELRDLTKLVSQKGNTDKHEKLRPYIQAKLEQGTPSKNLLNTLVTVGWPEEDVRKLIEEIEKR